MGQYFIIVNPIKKQYIDISDFAGENPKSSGVLRGFHAIAVAALACKLSEVEHTFGTMAGAWFSDPIIVAGDDDGEPNLYGIPTSNLENPRRNLYHMAKEDFENITYKSMAMVCEGRPEFSKELVVWAKENPPYVFVHLGNVVKIVGCNSLENALRDGFGDDWFKQYSKARNSYPMPI